MILSKLSRVFDAEEEQRLRSAWANPEVTIAAVRSRFHLTSRDIETLHQEFGPKAKESPVVQRFRIRRERQALARTLRRAP